MLGFAEQGLTVARLKSGDPLIFGRGGEELELLRDAGVESEIVPGITAGLAAAAALGIPLTDRRTASRLVFLTAQSAPGKPDPDWSAILSSDTTAVIYMPGEDYSRIAKRLREAGAPSERPCAIVAKVSGLEQQVFVTTVEQLRFTPPLSAPVIIIVGELAGHGNCELFGTATAVTQHFVSSKFEELW
jgi:uroporphyrin-III C-methyltransferase